MLGVRRQTILAFEHERRRLANRLRAVDGFASTLTSVGADPLHFHRTLEYIDIRGAPWLIKTTDNAGSATSVVYTSAGTLSADSLADLLEKIDTIVQKRGRDALDSASTYYSQTPFKDGNDDAWDVEFVLGGKSPPGYYALQFGTMVGPAVSKDDLKKMVTRYLARLEGEKATISRDEAGSVEAELVAVDPNRPIEVPENASNGGGWRLAIIGVGIVAALWWFFRSIKP